MMGRAQDCPSENISFPTQRGMAGSKRVGGGLKRPVGYGVPTTCPVQGWYFAEARYEDANALRHFRTVMQTLSIALEPGEVIVSQTHAMAWMTDAIEMDTHTGGGLFAGLKRAISGGSFFITEYAARARGEVAFAPASPVRSFRKSWPRVSRSSAARKPSSALSAPSVSTSFSSSVWAQSSLPARGSSCNA